MKNDERVERHHIRVMDVNRGGCLPTPELKYQHFGYFKKTSFVFESNREPIYTTLPYGPVLVFSGGTSAAGIQQSERIVVVSMIHMAETLMGCG